MTQPAAEPKRKSRRLLLLAAVVAIVLVGGGALLYFSAGGADLQSVAYHTNVTLTGSSNQWTSPGINMSGDDRIVWNATATDGGCPGGCTFQLFILTANQHYDYEAGQTVFPLQAPAISLSSGANQTNGSATLDLGQMSSTSDYYIVVCAVSQVFNCDPAPGIIPGTIAVSIEISSPS